MGEEGFVIDVEVDRTFVTPQCDFSVVSSAMMTVSTAPETLLKRVFGTSQPPPSISAVHHDTAILKNGFTRNQMEEHNDSSSQQHDKQFRSSTQV